MDPEPIEIPDHLRYRDGQYSIERFAGATVTSAPLRVRRHFTRMLRAVHRPWFAVWMPHGVAELTTVGRKSGEPRSTFIRAYRDGRRAYVVSITGEHALWLKNIRAHPEITLRFRDGLFTGIARDVSNEDERRAVERAFCRTRPFDYMENLVHRRGLPSRRKIVELHRAWLDGGTALIVELY